MELIISQLINKNLFKKFETISNFSRIARAYARIVYIIYNIILSLKRY